ncbi:MAG: DUF1538 domain-containing protein [Clostridia bacterium]|nr:DUF1538 domain-containing protein [Clostridia bacterium]
MRLKTILSETLIGILPILIVISILQFTIVPVEMDLYIKFLVGTVMVVIGLVMFLVGVEIGFLKIGESIGSALVKTGHLRMILLFTAVLGFAATLLEPDVHVFSEQASDFIAKIDAPLFMAIIALGVGLFMIIAFLRMFVKIPMKYIVFVSYTLSFIILIFCPQDLRNVAFDAGGVTTGVLTTPFVLSLAMGVTSMISQKERTTNSFGILGIASMGPILAVLLMGVIAR